MPTGRLSLKVCITGKDRIGFDDESQIDRMTPKRKPDENDFTAGLEG
jgi:hypothetical protein